MKWFSCTILLCLFLVSGCAHSPDAASSRELPAASPQPRGASRSFPPRSGSRRSAAEAPSIAGSGGGPAAPAGMSVKSGDASAEYADYVEEGGDQEKREGLQTPWSPSTGRCTISTTSSTSGCSSRWRRDTKPSFPRSRGSGWTISSRISPSPSGSSTVSSRRISTEQP